MARAILTEQAERDLEDIGDYIASDNPTRALSFIQEIREHCARIAEAPFGYAARPELGEGIRSCAHGRYLIVFLPLDTEVLIVRVIHGARELTQIVDRE